MGSDYSTLHDSVDCYNIPQTDRSAPPVHLECNNFQGAGYFSLSDDNARFYLGSRDDTALSVCGLYLVVPDILSRPQIHSKVHYQKEAGVDVVKVGHP